MANNNQIKSMLFVWLALILLDVFVVRDFDRFKNKQQR
jgi:hypothetical protein